MMNKTRFRFCWPLLPLFLGITTCIVWANVLADSAVATPLPTSLYPQGPSYSVVTLPVTNGIEYRFMADHHHFMTLVDHNGTFNFRPHPGCDVNGWGTSWYAQPFFPGATLQHTTVHTVTAAADGIHVIATGKVSRGTSSTYGDWSSTYQFSYAPEQMAVSGGGVYSLTLDGLIDSGTGDLNLYKIASNYLDDVPLLPDGQIGDTGDMNRAIVIGDNFIFTWTPPITPAYFPTDETDYLSIDVQGNLNRVDTVAMGYAAITPAFKPGLTVVFSSTQPDANMTFGGYYDVTMGQLFWADNVGITPLIRVGSPHTQFSFAMAFASQALEACTYLPMLVWSD